MDVLSDEPAASEFASIGRFRDDTENEADVG